MIYDFSAMSLSYQPFARRVRHKAQLSDVKIEWRQVLEHKHLFSILPSLRRSGCIPIVTKAASRPRYRNVAYTQRTSQLCSNVCARIYGMRV